MRQRKGCLSWTAQRRRVASSLKPSIIRPKSICGAVANAFFRRNHRGKVVRESPRQGPLQQRQQRSAYECGWTTGNPYAVHVAPESLFRLFAHLLLATQIPAGICISRALRPRERRRPNTEDQLGRPRQLRDSPSPSLS